MEYNSFILPPHNVYFGLKLRCLDRAMAKKISFQTKLIVISINFIPINNLLFQQIRTLANQINCVHTINSTCVIIIETYGIQQITSTRISKSYIILFMIELLKKTHFDLVLLTHCINCLSLVHNFHQSLKDVDLFLLLLILTKPINHLHI